MKSWKPKVGRRYYFIWGDLVENVFGVSSVFHHTFFRRFNSFRTQQEAESALKQIRKALNASDINFDVTLNMAKDAIKGRK